LDAVRYGLGFQRFQSFQPSWIQPINKSRLRNSLREFASAGKQPTNQQINKSTNQPTHPPGNDCVNFLEVQIEFIIARN
jgi:hypothetical protein